MSQEMRILRTIDPDGAVYLSPRPLRHRTARRLHRLLAGSFSQSYSAKRNPDDPIDVVDFLVKSFPQGPALVKPSLVVPGGLTVFGAQPKAYKSELVVQCAWGRGGGRPWLGFETTPGHTLYLNAELSDAALQSRLRRFLKACPKPPRGTLIIKTTVGSALHLDTHGGIKTLETWVQQARPDLVIIDPFSKYLGGSELQPADVLAFLRNLERLRGTYGFAVLLIHHHRKPPRRGRGGYMPSAHDLSGFSQLYRDADAVIVSNGQPNVPRMTLAFDLRHAQHDPITITRGLDGWWRRVTTPILDPSLKQALVILKGQGPLRHDDWKMALQQTAGKSDATARRRMKEAARAKLAAKTPSGEYQVTAQGLKALQADRAQNAQGAITTV